LIYHRYGVKNIMVRGSNNMGMGFNMPWVGGQNTMDIGVKIPWIRGSIYHG
jgi:hypothetical protein